MSPSGVTFGSGGRGRRTSKSISRADRAGLQFPVGRIDRYLKEGNYGSRISETTSVYLAAVLEYIAAEVLDSAGKEAKDAGKGRITPTQIQAAVNKDEDLNNLFGNATIPGASLIPNIHPSLLQSSERKNKQRAGASTSS